MQKDTIQGVCLYIFFCIYTTNCAKVIILLFTDTIISVILTITVISQLTSRYSPCSLLLN